MTITDAEKNTPETTFSYDIDNRVFQSITVKCLLGIEGITFIEGNLIDHLLGRESTERIKGVTVEQDPNTHAVNVKIELNIMFGLPIQTKAGEIQKKLTESIESLTGALVSGVHVVFRNVYTKEARMEGERIEDMDEIFAENLEPTDSE